MANIFAPNNNDTLLTGTANDDTISGAAGDDTLLGLGGQDSLFGYEGNDSIFGGGGPGIDILAGGSGNDLIDGGDGVDFVSYATSKTPVLASISTQRGTGEGSDTLIGIEGIYGSSGNDYLAGNVDSNYLWGLAGDDSLLGLAGDDFLSGLDGKDILLGGDGKDILLGGAGDDYLSDGAGDDSLNGGLGNDLLFGEAGNDTIDGGEGFDILFYNVTTSPVVVNLTTGIATGDGTDSLIGIENISGGSGNDSLTGNSGTNFLYGFAGDDFLSGLDGKDYLHGGEGNNSILGGLGDDSLFDGIGNSTIRGGEGNDSIGSFGGNDLMVGDAGDDTLYSIETLAGANKSSTLLGGLGNDVIFGGFGKDFIDGGDGFDLVSYVEAKTPVLVNLTTGIATGDGTDSLIGIENIFGGSGNDFLTGNTSSNVLSGLAGDDFLSGLDGGDFLFGSDGKDILNGGSGDDYLNGGAGDDSLNGGLGNDFLSGGDGNNTLVGGGGADFLSGGVGNDFYQLDGTTAQGSFISDLGGTNSLSLSGVTLSLTLAPGTTGLGRDGTTLVIDLNKDGVLNAQDVQIFDFFATPTGTTPGSGVIQTVGNFSSTQIFSSFAVSPPTPTPTSLPPKPIPPTTPTPTSVPTPPAPQPTPIEPTIIGLTPTPTSTSTENPTPTPTPTGTDITVSPTTGLTTTELGGTDTFSIKLNSQPTANVTIGLGSSNTIEGVISPAFVTFAPDNWNQAQTITVKGVDDKVADGNKNYTIVTSPAVSTDPKYNNLNAADVTVTNIETNRPPQLNKGNETTPWLSSTRRVGKSNSSSQFEYEVPEKAFIDPDAGDKITYSATLKNGEPLPSWLTFDPKTRIFKGDLKNANGKTVFIKLIATDNSGATASDDNIEFRYNPKTGVVIDGYIQGATIFFDANKNGVKDDSEPFATTDEKGEYELDIPDIFDTNKNGNFDPEEGNLVAFGGTDTATGLPLETPVSAPADATVVTLLTSLVTDLMDGGMSQSEAESKVKSALSIPAGVDLLDLDPIASTTKNEPGGVETLVAMTKVQNVITQTTSLIDGASTADNTAITKAVVAAINSKIQSGGSLDLNDVAQVQSIIQQSVANVKQVDSNLNTQKLSEITPQASQVMAEANQSTDRVKSNFLPEFIPSEIAKVQKVTLGESSILKIQANL